MTGTWRDTLFVWEGAIQVSKGAAATKPAQPSQEHSTKNASNSVASLHWKGTWVGCEYCPDARTAVTPTAAAFGSSDMEFEVRSSLPKREKDDLLHAHEVTQENDLHLYEMTGGSGWDLGQGDEKERHTDATHIVATKVDFQREDCAVEDSASLVVAMGHNNFGAFVSAGYVNLVNKTTLRLTLARRYLDDKDMRAKWTAQQLYEKMETDPGMGSTLQSTAPWTAGPWMQSEKMTARKRKRTQKEK